MYHNFIGKHLIFSGVNSIEVVVADGAEVDGTEQLAHKDPLVDLSVEIWIHLK